MVLEQEPVPFLLWLHGRLAPFGLTLGLGLVILALFAFLILAFRYGPTIAGDSVYKFFVSAFQDLRATSPRRIWALAWLAIQESLRRRVMVGMLVYLVILLFTGWFLDTTSNDPARLYLSFVLNTTTGLALVIGLFLSSFSLPTDIKNRTIYSVVTKPVRPHEMLIGRILGFSLIGTGMLAVMGLLSYFFVIRSLSHTHEVDLASLKPSANEKDVLVGRTTMDQNHRHEVTIRPQGYSSTDIAQGHWHEITVSERDGKTTYQLSSPQEMFPARVPHYGKLAFKDRNGQSVEKGISVGAEWKYRSYVEGGMNAAAVWTFKDVTPEKFENGLPLELNIRVFRTYKGVITRGVLGSIQVKNPRTGKASALDTFQAKDFAIDRRMIPVKLQDVNNKPINLFEDLVSDGEVEVWLQCMEPSQYFGVAQADMYLRAADASFGWNFFKGYIGSWVMMVLITAIAVMCSTFLSGGVAWLATLAAIVLGFFSQFVIDLSDSQFATAADRKIMGGGPIESMIRMANQSNMITEMEEGLSTTVIKTVDGVLLRGMSELAKVLPNFRTIDNVNYVTEGFNIPGDVVWTQLFAMFGYLTAVGLVGYFFLKTREMAR